MLDAVDPGTGTITIGSRFCGPPISGNGGWTAGSLAELLDGPIEVTLRAPPPLDAAMTVDRPDAETVTLTGPNGLVAEARAVDPLPVDTVPAVTVEDADRARLAYLDAVGDHPFPTCFVCGPDRSPGDGLCLFSGPVEGRGQVVAAPWTPDGSLAGPNGGLDTRAVWAALDCPGGFAHILWGHAGVLGRMAADIHQMPRIDRPYLVIGWADPPDGRKLPSHTVIVDASDGTVMAIARSTWIEVDPADFR